MCSYEISIITKKIIGVANFTIYRKTNTLIINLKNRASISLEEIKNSFENEDYKNEIKIYSPIQKSKDTNINYRNRLKDKEERY